MFVGNPIASNTTPSEIAATVRKIAKDLDEPSNQLAQNSKDYETAVRQIDLAMDGIMDLLEMADNHEAADSLTNSLTGLNEKTVVAFSQMDKLRGTPHQASKLSKDLRAPCLRIDRAVASIQSSREFFINWEARAKLLG